MRTKIVLLAATFVALKGLTASAAIGPPGEWQHWQAEVEINNLASRQRGEHFGNGHGGDYLRALVLHLAAADGQSQPLQPVRPAAFAQ